MAKILNQSYGSFLASLISTDSIHLDELSTGDQVIEIPKGSNGITTVSVSTPKTCAPRASWLEMNADA